MPRTPSRLLERLTQLGLNEKEAQAYLALVEFGTRTTSFIAKRAKLNRGTAYLALHSLLEKGLASKNVRNNIQYFTALNPEIIRDFLERKQKKIVSQIENSGDLISQLTALANPLSSKPQIQFFDGVEGARAAMLQSLQAKEPLLRSFLSIHDIADFVGADFFEEYTNRRIANGPFLHALRDREKDEKAFATNPYAQKYLSSDSDRREIRYLSHAFQFPMSLYLYDEKVLALSSKQEGYALIIESADLSNMQKQFFDLLWEGGEQC